MIFVMLGLLITPLSVRCFNARLSRGLRASLTHSSSQTQTRPLSALLAANQRSGGGGGNSRRTSSYKSRPSAGGGRRNSGSGGRSGSGSQEGTRLNKCIPSLSRRGADDAIASGLVTVNGESVINPGHRVQYKDVVKYEGKTQHWQETAEAKKKSIGAQRVHEERNFIYLKYWKPRGVTCTSDPSDPTNIISAGGFNLFPQRVFTVGRLDKESTGLILLTSDGRVNHSLLGTRFESSPVSSKAAIEGSVKEKVYVVDVGPRPPSEDQLQRLRDGVVITTEAQKDNNSKRGTSKQKKLELRAKTLPCKICRLSGGSGSDGLSSRLEFTLVEGRNRQIRKMVESIGLSVQSLHRTGFANISLKGLSEGNWAELDQKEMQVIERTIAAAAVRRDEE